MAQENLRQLCVFKLANQSNQPWQWWDYVTRFADECKMSEQNYNEECAEKARLRIGVGVGEKPQSLWTCAWCQGHALVVQMEYAG